MDDKPNIIGLSELLDEVAQDLNELRKKHANDYSLRTITMWWELERERLVVRHGKDNKVRWNRTARNVGWYLAVFFAGSVAMAILQNASRLLFL